MFLSNPSQGACRGERKGHRDLTSGAQLEGEEWEKSCWDRGTIPVQLGTSFKKKEKIDGRKRRVRKEENKE